MLRGLFAQIRKQDQFQIVKVGLDLAIRRPVAESWRQPTPMIIIIGKLQ